MFDGYYANSVDSSVPMCESSSNVSINVAVQSSHPESENLTLAPQLVHGHHPPPGFSLNVFDENGIKEEYPTFQEYRFQPAPLNCQFQQ